MTAIAAGGMEITSWGSPLSVTSARSKMLRAKIRCWETTTIISL